MVTRTGRNGLRSCGVAVLLSLTTPAAAADFTWTDASGLSSWFGDAANWSPVGGPPDSSADRAFFNSNAAVYFEAHPLPTPDIWTNRQLIVSNGTTEWGMDLIVNIVTGERKPGIYRLEPSGSIPN